jgi:hypothetical protein
MAKLDSSIIDRLKGYSTLAALDMYMFHGSGEPIIGDLRPGGYDDAFWCADNPCVAQSYIPEVGSLAMFHIDKFRLEDRVSPSKDGFGIEILRAMGFADVDFDVEYDAYGRLKSYRIPKNHPTYRDAAIWLNTSLGYPALDDTKYSQSYDIKLSRKNGSSEIVHASYKKTGTLFIIEKSSSLIWKDFTKGREGDLMEPDYHRHDWFAQAATEGYDGVIIHDWCQSKNHGNVGHKSWGLLPSGLHKINYAEIPAANFDWPASGPISEMITEEFKAILSPNKLLSVKML